MVLSPAFACIVYAFLEFHPSVWVRYPCYLTFSKMFVPPLSPPISLPLLSFFFPLLLILRHLVNLFSDLSNSFSCKSVAGLFSGPKTDFYGLLSTHLHNLILFPKNLTCSDWTHRTESKHTPSQMSMPAVLVCTCCSCSSSSRVWLSWRAVWDGDLPGAVGKQVGDLQWWLNHLLGPSEGWATCWAPWGHTSSPVHVFIGADPVHVCVHSGAVLTSHYMTWHHPKTV